MPARARVYRHSSRFARLSVLASPIEPVDPNQVLAENQTRLVFGGTGGNSLHRSQSFRPHPFGVLKMLLEMTIRLAS